MEEHSSPEAMMLDGDLIDQGLARVFGKRFHRSPTAIILGAVFFLWLPPLLLRVIDIAIAPSTGTGYLLDYGAYSQFLIGAPLLLIARLILDREFTLAKSSILDSSFLGAQAMKEFEDSTDKTRTFLRSKAVNRSVIALGFAMSMAWFLGEMTNGLQTYHSLAHDTPFFEIPSLAGAYIAFVSVPGYTITLVYWASRYAAWVFLLWKFSSLKPRLEPFHPDRCAGLGFLSRPIAAFGLAIFAVGAVTASITLYKINIEHAMLTDPEVIASPLAYALLAPVAFVAPFFFFTGALYRSKADAMDVLNRNSRKAAREIRHLLDGTSFSAVEMTPFEDDELNEKLYERIQGMRIWPLDLGSISKLFGSSVVPMIPLALKFFELPEPIQGVLDKFFG